jgi:hypothetical protein
MSDSSSWPRVSGGSTHCRACLRTSSCSVHCSAWARLQVATSCTSGVIRHTDGSLLVHASPCFDTWSGGGCGQSTTKWPGWPQWKENWPFPCLFLSHLLFTFGYDVLASCDWSAPSFRNLLFRTDVDHFSRKLASSFPLVGPILISGSTILDQYRFTIWTAFAFFRANRLSSHVAVICVLAWHNTLPCVFLHTIWKTLK